MLTLIEDRKSKETEQSRLEDNLKAALTCRGNLKIGFRPKTVEIPVYSAGDGRLWVAFGGPTDAGVRRYWNAFGIFRPLRPSQEITIEINIPIDRNTRRVAGFFARDGDTGDILLMHSGGIGGGRHGIGKHAFLDRLGETPVNVAASGGRVWTGIPVGKLADPDLVRSISKFVCAVGEFKDRAA